MPLASWFAAGTGAGRSQGERYVRVWPDHCDVAAPLRGLSGFCGAALFGIVRPAVSF